MLNLICRYSKDISDIGSFYSIFKFQTIADVKSPHHTDRGSHVANIPALLPHACGHDFQYMAPSGGGPRKWNRLLPVLKT